VLTPNSPQTSSAERRSVSTSVIVCAVEMIPVQANWRASYRFRGSKIQERKREYFAVVKRNGQSSQR